MANKITGQTGVNLIMKFEGCRLTAYRCSAGVLTIGYGHTGSDVYDGLKISQAQAEALLKKDLKKFEDFVNNPIYVPVTESLNQNQFDALVSFAFNCGQGSLKTLCKGRTLSQIVEAMMKYNKAKVKGVLTVLPGLTRRHAAEQALFNSSTVQDDATKTNFNTKGNISVSSNCLILQKAINKDGIGNLVEDGKLGPKTKAAINNINLSAEYDKVNGKWVVGSKGEVVRFVQMKLGLTEDGLFGAGTRNAVIAYQETNNLTADGVVGAVTLITMI